MSHNVNPNWQPPAGWKHPGFIVSAFAAVVLVAVAVVLGIVVFQSDGDPTASTTFTDEPTTPTEARGTSPRQTRAPTRPAPPPRSDLTIAEYIQQNDITETPVSRGDPGAPTIDLPIPPGFEDAGDAAPEWAYGAIVSTDPAHSADPATVIAIFSKLTGDVESQAILRYAPNELHNLPGFEAVSGMQSELSGFPAYQLGGSYIRNGVRRAIAQKTVVIPGSDGLYVLQLNADGTQEQEGVLDQATATIDEETVITP